MKEYLPFKRIPYKFLCEVPLYIQNIFPFTKVGELVCTKPGPSVMGKTMRVPPIWVELLEF